MKKFIFILLTILFLVTISCTEEQIMTYRSGNFLQFSRIANDSSVFSFLEYPDLPQVRFPLPVELTGMPIGHDRIYKVSVVQELTNAPKANYQLEPEYIFRASLPKDTCWIVVKKTPEISVKPVRLVLELAESDDFKVGQREYSLAVISISNVVSKPAWWTKTVTDYYLGTYSDKKYLLFISVTGVVNFDSADAEKLMHYSLLLKYYLQKEKEEGRTVYEEDGRELTVSLIAG